MTLYKLILYAIRGATQFDELPLDNNDWVEIIDFATVWDRSHGNVKLEDLILMEVPKEDSHDKKEVPKEDSHDKKEGFEVTIDDVLDQMCKMNLLEPENMTFTDFVNESDKVGIGVMKAINGHHRDIVGNTLNIIMELYIRRTGE